MADNILIYVLVVVALVLSTHARQCEKLGQDLFSVCLRAGINSTITFSSFTSNPSRKLIISSLTTQTIKDLEKCSPHIGFLVCSVSVPQCLEGVHSPVLPCKRVCEDIVRGCDVNRIHNGDVEWMKGLCKILPEDDSTKCIEPNGFKPMHKKVPILKNCSKLFIPQCQGFGFNFTMKSFVEQLYLSQQFDIILNETVISSSSPRCKYLVNEFLCTELIPPCFQDKPSEPAIYTVCKDRCQVLWKECPAVIQKKFGIFEECSMDAEEETDYAGFCRVNKWPGTHRWIKAKYKVAEVIQKAGSPSPSPAIHVLAFTITLSVVITCAVLASLSYCHIKRKRVLNMRGYWRHGDEEEEEMAVIMTT